VQKRESGLREEETHQRRLSLDRTAELETKLIALREGKVSHFLDRTAKLEPSLSPSGRER
jgi:hypothetical protein